MNHLFKKGGSSSFATSGRQRRPESRAKLRYEFKIICHERLATLTGKSGKFHCKFCRVKGESYSPLRIFKAAP